MHMEVELGDWLQARVTLRPGEAPEIVVIEETCYPLERDRERPARPEERAEIERRIGRGEFRMLTR